MMSAILYSHTKIDFDTFIWWIFSTTIIGTDKQIVKLQLEANTFLKSYFHKNI
jgi:hypothetical protein